MSYLSDSALEVDESDPNRSSSVGIVRPDWASPFSQGVQDAERSVERRRSVECSSIRTSISGTALVTKKVNDPPFTVFIIKIVSGPHSWEVRRRYTDFYYLHRQLQKFIKEESLPALPPKRYIGSSNSPAFVEERRAQLEVYLRDLVNISAVWSTTDFVRFLDNSNNTLMFMWNFERMRKMQDMLGAMTLENKNQTEKLSTELDSAKAEVAVLRERIYRMEMLFLQHATGVATEELPLSTIRSLSGVGDGDTVLSSVREGSEEDGTSLKEYDADAEAASTASMNYSISFERSPSTSMHPDQVIEILKLARGNTPLSDSNKSSERSGAAPDDDSVQHRLIAMSRQLQDAVRLSNELLGEKVKFIPGSAEKLKPTSAADAASASKPSFDELRLQQEAALAPTASDEEDPLVMEELKFEGKVLCSPPTPEEPWIHRLFDRFNEIVAALVPTTEAVIQRLLVLQYVKGVIHKSLGAQIFPLGSFVSKSYLPGGDVDITAFLCPNNEESWFVKVNEALCISSMNNENNTDAVPGSSRVSVRNVSFINAEVKIVKCVINNIEVDISSNQLSAIYSQALIEQVDTFIGYKHLFKRSILLIKAWCKYESPRYTFSAGGVCGTREGRLSTYAVCIMVTWIFNKYGRTIHQPLQALGLFLKYYARFDWSKYALNVHGVVDVVELQPVENQDDYYSLGPSGGYIPTDILDNHRKRFEVAKTSSMTCKTKAESSEQDDTSSQTPRLSSYDYYRRGIMNIMDPVQPKNNLGRTVDVAGYHAIRFAFQAGHEAFRKMCLNCQKIPVPETAPPQEQGEKTAEIVKPLGRDPATRDVPHVRAFLEITTATLREMGCRVNHSAAENAGFPELDAQSEDLELSMKHAELVLANIVSPEALAHLIAQILEQRGPLPVGEIGKLLQECTGNETLSATIKNNFKGLKKLVEGYSHIFQLGTEHPFNPHVYLSYDHLEKAGYDFFHEKVKQYFVYSGIYPASPKTSFSTSGSPPGSPVARSLGSNSDGYFLPMTKASSFREQYQSIPYVQHLQKKSGSFSGSAPNTARSIGHYGSSDTTPGSSFEQRSAIASGQYDAPPSAGRRGNQSGKNTRRKDNRPGKHQHGYQWDGTGGRPVLDESAGMPLPPPMAQQGYYMYGVPNPVMIPQQPPQNMNMSGSPKYMYPVYYPQMPPGYMLPPQQMYGMMPGQGYAPSGSPKSSTASPSSSTLSYNSSPAVPPLGLPEQGLPRISENHDSKRENSEA